MKLSKDVRRVIEWLESDFGEGWSRFAHNEVGRASLIDEYHTCQEQFLLERRLTIGSTLSAHDLDSWVSMWDSEGYIEDPFWSGSYKFEASDLDAHFPGTGRFSIFTLYPDEEWVT